MAMVKTEVKTVASVGDVSSLLVLLTVLFVGLKLTGQIGWNWFWVVSPFAIPVIVGALALFIQWGLGEWS